METIPTNLGEFTPENLFNEVTYAAYVHNRASGISVEQWKKISTHYYDTVKHKDLIEKTISKIDSMERRYQSELRN